MEMDFNTSERSSLDVTSDLRTASGCIAVCCCFCDRLKIVREEKDRINI